ncbi:hypothetical protein [Natronococcus occultus]|uniref:Uncharacterized protein n=1 Tax=Natronococcus occultus SP4 TaxID=694430 RepID=L0K3K3_9EURY|nr:hypothetical protein [Natronococcus occultus]AGB39601.1 hypothetical protein Natoc_3901 [Natronococcus occultus SP4]
MSSVDWPSVAIGAYAGLLGVLGGVAVGVEGAGLIVACGLVCIGIAVALGGRPEAWVTAGRRRLLAVPMVGPLVSVVALDDVGVADISLATRFSLLGLVALGLVVWVLGTRVYAAHAAGELRVRWVATPDRRRRRRLHAATLLFGVGSVGAFAGTLYGLPSSFLTAGVVAIVVLQISVRRDRVYEACEHGLRYQESGAVTTRFLPWDRFDGVRETEDAVVLERRRWLDERMAGDEVPADARAALATAVGDAGGD